MVDIVLSMAGASLGPHKTRGSRPTAPEVERRRREDRGAEGAEGVECGEGVSPSPLTRVSNGVNSPQTPTKNSQLVTIVTRVGLGQISTTVLNWPTSITPYLVQTSYIYL